MVDRAKPGSRARAVLETMRARTVADYEGRAEAFWAGTRDHDVSQNYAAFLRSIEGEPPFRLLDLGCGPGRDIAHFRQLGHHVVGLDATPRFVAMARELTGCEILQQDFFELALGERRFDGIFANASLFHVPGAELDRVLRDLRRALELRGVLFCSNPHGPDTEGWNGERFGAFHRLDTWRRYVSGAGFEEIEHYYRPEGKPREQQPWLVTVWRKVPWSLRGAFEAGARDFDAGAFWDAHEAWEERWRDETDDDARRALQGLIQVAAALHKLLVMRSPEAASSLFAKALAKLDAVPADFEIDLASFRAGVEACARALTEGRFDPAAIPRALQPGIHAMI